MKNTCAIKKERNLKSISENFALFYRNLFDNYNVTRLVVSPNNIPTSNQNVNYIYVNHTCLSTKTYIIPFSSKFY